MPIYEYKGQQYDLPEGLSNEDAKLKIQKYLGEVPNETAAKEPKQEGNPSRTITEELARQVGLTGRAAYEGALAIPTMASDALVSLYNYGTKSNLPLPSQAQSQLLTNVGVPVPENAVERAVQVGAQAMMGQAGLTKAAQAAGASASPLLLKPTQQITAAGASGAASQPASELVLEKTDSPLAAVVASLAAGSLVGKAAGSVADKVASGRAPPVTIADIKQKAQRAYTSMEQMDVKARPQSVQNMINQTEANLAPANFNPQMDAHRPVAQLLDQFRQMAGTTRVPFTKLEQMRSAAVSMSREAGDASTRRLAGIVVSNIDDYLGRLNSKDLMPGTQRGEDAVRAVGEARKNWKLQARAQVLEDLLETAALRAEDPKASEADILRRSLTNLAVNEKKMRQFSEDEQAAIKKAIKSKGPEAILTFFAKFNPERGFLGAGALTGGVGTSVYSSQWTPGAGAVALTTAGYLADKAQSALKRRSATNLVSDILQEKTGQPSVDYRIPGLFGATLVNPEGQ